ncbi:DUF1285 domain-containing protein [Labrys sp. KB_33_2]|uniref:DUF1285 domain-containing protein n=1 Tax=Labrys sp. KB_33_2 TaxID=3237479 RepID=UPI003F8FB093
MAQTDLAGLTKAIKEAGKQAGARPVHLWNPPFCGDIDMRIAADGSWHYMKSPIGRIELVKLFASILRRDEDRYVLVTPVERVGIVVDDVPFVAVEMRVEEGASGRTLAFRTNVDDWTEAGPDHPMRFEIGASEGLKPYVHVRAGLWARVNRALYYDLADLGEVREIDGVAMFGVTSGGSFFAMAPADEIGAEA